MFKLAAPALVTLLMLGAPVTAGAQTILGLPRFDVAASLTKVSENTYDITYWFEWGSIPEFPVDYYDEYGWYYYYYLFRGWAFSGVTGNFGEATSLTEYGHGSLNEYHTYGMDGAFRVTQAPTSVLSISATEEIRYEIYRPDGSYGGRNIWGTVEGTTHLYGEIPTSIGQTTTWSITPEPPTGLLGAVLLAGFYIARRKGSRFRPT